MRFTRLLMIGAGAALLVASVYRAATYPFTHDEALSYAGFTYEPYWAKEANNHLLNTWLMRGCAALFGTSELSLRLPNVLALVLYLACALLVLERVEHPVTRLAGFVLLALNPFVLDFFTVARGYGLALAFLMASVWLFVRGSLHLSLVAGALAVTAIYVLVNAFVPLLALVLWQLVRRGRKREAILVGAAGAIFLLIIGLEVLRLGDAGLLYFGGAHGFVEDTLLSLVRATLYVHSSLDIALAIAVIAAFVALAILRKRDPLFLILGGAVLLTLLEHYVAGTRFPLDRAALYLVPLFALALTFALRGKPGVAISALIVLLGTVHFARTFNPHTNYLWSYDAHNKKVLATIDRDRAGRNVRMGVSWQLEPSFNYYRVTRGYTWLAPLTRRPVNGSEDYVYAFTLDASQTQGTVLARYPDTGTVLLITPPAE